MYSQPAIELVQPSHLSLLITCFLTLLLHTSASQSKTSKPVPVFHSLLQQKPVTESVLNNLCSPISFTHIAPPQMKSLVSRHPAPLPCNSSPFLPRPAFLQSCYPKSLIFCCIHTVHHAETLNLCTLSPVIESQNH